MNEWETAGEAESGHRDHIVLAPDDAQALPAALGWNQPRTVDELRDVTGERIIREGRSVPECEHLIGAYSEQRAAVTVLRSDAAGTFTQNHLWMSPRGILWTSDMPEGIALRTEPGGSSFRVLIDMLRLQPRPAPQPGFDPVSVSSGLLTEAADFEGGPEGPAEARREIAGRVRSIAPGIADCLQIGDAELVTFLAEWDGAEGGQRRKLIYFDTPAGLLVHSHEVAFLRQRHHLEPAPTWVVWSQIVARLPQPGDVEHWSTARHGGGQT